MKDYNKEITYESYNEFCNVALEEGYEIKQITGALNDIYIIYNDDKKLSFKGVKPRKFIILYPQFKTAWTNTFHILMTDDESMLDKFLDDDN